MTLYLRSLAQMWRGPLIAGVVIALFLPLAVISYRSVDLSVFEAMPDALKRLMGIADGASAELLAYTLVLGTYGGLTLASVAIAVCANAAGGDEAARRLPVLLATPLSRSGYIWARLLAAVTVILGMCGIVLVASVVTAQLLGITTGDAHLVAQWAHLVGTVMFHGLIAFAIAGATGRKGRGILVAALVMVVGMFTSGLLPLYAWGEEPAQWVPWHWLEGSMPLVNGTGTRELGLLCGGAVILVLIGTLTFPPRDLRNQPSGGVLDRLRQDRRLRAVLERVRLTSRGLVTHTLGRNLVLTSVITMIMFAVMGVLMGPLYTSMEEGLAAMSETMSPEMLALFGAGDFSTPEGFYQAETLGLMAPIAVITVSVAMAATLAGEERARRAGLLLAQPVSRHRVLASVALGMVTHAVVIAVATGVGIWAGSLLGALGMDVVRIAVAAGMLALLGLAMGSITLAVDAALGRAGLGTWVALAVAVTGHFGNALLQLDPDTKQWAAWSPFNWYGDVNPLSETPDPWRVVALVILAAVLVALAFPLYQRRDLRHG